MSRRIEDIDHVSILSQPEGRELQRRKTRSGTQAQFQSSPSPKAGSYRGLQIIGKAKYVSILSQPEGRELP